MEANRGIKITFHGPVELVVTAGPFATTSELDTFLQRFWRMLLVLNRARVSRNGGHFDIGVTTVEVESDKYDFSMCVQIIRAIWNGLYPK